MNGMVRSSLAIGLGAFLAGGVGGWWLGHRAVPEGGAVPEAWLARIDDAYITPAQFIEEMRRRGGDQPGQFHDIEQRRQLLDDLVYRAVLSKAAQQQGLTEQPDVRRAIESLVATRYLNATLRQSQRALDISDEEVLAYYEAHAEEYVVPARKRIAMLRIAVSPEAGETAWTEALARMEKARDEAAALAVSVPHFGTLAREISDDAASRYRGGVIGWISEGRSDRYSWDRTVLDAARSLDEAGALSPVLRGADGVYLVRLVESEPRQSRGLEQLSAGIRQRLLQDRLARSEADFRRDVMQQVGVEVRESVLASIAPLSPPGQPRLPEPPAMPQDQG